MTQAENRKGQRLANLCEFLDSRPHSAPQARPSRKVFVSCLYKEGSEVRPQKPLAGWASDNTEGLRLLEESLKSFDGLLKEMGRNIRMEKFEEEHGTLGEEERKKVEERRRRAELQRKLRDQAKANAGKTPMRRVAMRLELGRELGQVDICSGTIPMQPYKSISSVANETIDVVNVIALQGRCLGLTSSASCSFKEVKLLAEMEAAQVRWKAQVAKNAARMEHQRKKGALITVLPIGTALGA